MGVKGLKEKGLKVLILGGGGREHALLWKISKSRRVEYIFIAPGNGGTHENVDINPLDGKDVLSFCKEKGIDLVVVGPEAPLSKGVVDVLEDEGIFAFGPRREPALIETSKAFSKELMKKYGIPCPEGEIFSSYDEAESYIRKVGVRVVKADGLCGGKGSIVPESLEDAISALRRIMIEKVFGDAGDKVVIEERLYGREVSLIGITDGENIIPLLPAQDYKRALDGDKGPNTGGMGAFSPVPFFTRDLVEEALERVLKRAVYALSREEKRYKGALYAGLMLTDEGIKVLEFNARFGDPETQAILPLMKTDLVDIFDAVIRGEISGMDIEWEDGACVCVVMASKGYPGKYETGYEIELGDLEDVIIFHAGTKREGERLLTSGGRVLNVVGKGRDISEAREKVYKNINKIKFEGAYWRRDIGCGM